MRDSPYIDNLLRKLDAIPMSSPGDLARMLPLYIRVVNDQGVVNNVSAAYIDNYDGKGVFRKFSRHFNRMYEMFLRNGMDDDDRRAVFKAAATHVVKMPTTVKGMEFLGRVVVEESHARLKEKKADEVRRETSARFRTAIKKYLNLTYTLGYNEPSACARDLAQRHKIDKYVMSGDFPVLLLPFMPEVEDEIRRCYEHYVMKDAWEVLKGRYFDHKPEWSNLALEIKSSFRRPIANFSDYFDRLYTDTYYRKMLEARAER